VEGDAEHLKRAFINVIDNAVKYSPQRGAVVIELTRSGDEAVVKVTDRGAGIDEAETEAVFKRFYRSPHARKERAGSGLGLSIARELVTAHSGEITIASRLSEGTTVTIELPVHEPDSAHGSKIV